MYLSVMHAQYSIIFAMFYIATIFGVKILNTHGVETHKSRILFVVIVCFLVMCRVQKQSFTDKGNTPKVVKPFSFQ